MVQVPWLMFQRACNVGTVGVLSAMVVISLPPFASVTPSAEVPAEGAEKINCSCRALNSQKLFAPLCPEGASLFLGLAIEIVGKQDIAVTSNMAVARTLLFGEEAFEIGVEIFKRMFNNFFSAEKVVLKNTIYLLLDSIASATFHCNFLANWL